MRKILGCLLVAVLAVAAPASIVFAESTAQEVGYGAGSVVSTLLYAPFKLTFCVIGAVTSVFTLPFGGPRTAEKVVTAGCGGTWAITPDVLKGQEQVRFIGSVSSDETAPRPTATRR